MATVVTTPWMRADRIRYLQDLNSFDLHGKTPRFARLQIVPCAPCALIKAPQTARDRPCLGHRHHHPPAHPPSQSPRRWCFEWKWAAWWQWWCGAAHHLAQRMGGNCPHARARTHKRAAPSLIDVVNRKYARGATEVALSNMTSTRSLIEFMANIRSLYGIPRFYCCLPPTQHYYVDFMLIHNISVPLLGYYRPYYIVCHLDND